jgi:hypothetical protein
LKIICLCIIWDIYHAWNEVLWRICTYFKVFRDYLVPVTRASWLWNVILGHFRHFNSHLL